MTNNKFIVFEGIDCAGKSTQADLLKDYFIQRGSQALLSPEPSSGPIGKLIREMLKTKVIFTHNPRKFDEQMAYLFAADRHYHLYNEVDGVFKLIKDGFNVISTRYYFSSIAYNAYTPEDFEFVKSLNAQFPNPDLVVYIDIPVEISLARLSDRSLQEVYEGEEKLTRVSQNYQDIFANYNGLLLRVDGTKDQDFIHHQIVNCIQEIGHRA